MYEEFNLTKVYVRDMDGGYSIIHHQSPTLLADFLKIMEEYLEPTTFSTQEELGELYQDMEPTSNFYIFS